MQELLETLTRNPYTTAIFISLGITILGLVMSGLAMLFEEPNKYIFATGMVVVVTSMIIATFMNAWTQYEQREAIHDIKAQATKEGNKLFIHSESKWISDGIFEIVGENDDHYFVKDERRVIEVKKLEMGK